MIYKNTSKLMRINEINGNSKKLSEIIEKYDQNN